MKSILISKRMAVLIGLIASPVALAGVIIPLRSYSQGALSSLTRQRTSGVASRYKSEVKIEEKDGVREITCNGIPDHTIGQFTGAGNPNPMSPQDYHYKVPISPEPSRDSVTTQPYSARQQKGIADRSTYLADFIAQCQIDWPKNRMMNIIAHGHSVPAGYHKTPEVKPFDSYPHLLHAGLKQKFPHAVINVFVTAIGGENAESGANRFEQDVLSHRPDVVLIDYSLNDRGLGLERAGKAWRKMIELAQAKRVKVILLTPTPDQSVKWDDPNDPLGQHAAQVRALAAEYHTGLVDSLAA
ncbi:MAG: SGNH/GDSL hydrolase family protein, partial [Chthonomonadales bacterium]